MDVLSALDSAERPLLAHRPASISSCHIRNMPSGGSALPSHPSACREKIAALERHAWFEAKIVTNPLVMGLGPPWT
jgi:hypothetical protein